MEEGIVQRPFKTSSSLWFIIPYLCLCAKTTLFLFSLMGIYNTILVPIYKSLSQAPPIICNCGNSIEEALSRDCKFDSLATAWLPPACRDDELTEEFDRSGPGPHGEWYYYLTQNKSQVISIDQVAILADNKDEEARQFWMTSEWHTVHCLFYWRKSFRALQKSKSGGRSPGAEQLERSASGAEHINHCVKEILRGRDPQSISVTSSSGFGDSLVDL